MEHTHVQRAEVIVVGAGLAGLAAAQLVKRAGRSVIVVDGRPAGGRAVSDIHDGFTFNRGPHALYLGGPAQRVLDQLGVRLPGGPPSNETFGRLGDTVAPLPAGARTLATTKLLGVRGKLAIGKLLGGLQRIKAASFAAVSVTEWLDGLRLPADARALVLTLVRVSSYGNQPDEMSAELAISQMQMALANGVRYLDGGWQALVDQLAVGLDVRRHEVISVVQDGSAAAAVTEAGSFIGDAVVLAAGSPAVTARLLGRAPYDVGPPIEAACLDIGARLPSSPKVLLGIDEPLYLSTHCPPARLAPAGHAVVCAARYIAPGDALSSCDQRAELAAHAALGGIAEATIVTRRYLHRMTVVSAMATAEYGGLAGRPSVTDTGSSRVVLAGDWVGPTGHMTDASLASAADAARLVCTKVAS